MGLETKLVGSGKSILKCKPKEQHVYSPDLITKGSKALRSDEMDKAYITINGVDYDADEKSLDRMARIVSIANWKFNQGIASGVAPATVYDSVYKQTIEWTGKDDLEHTVQIESIAEVLYGGMENMALLWKTFR